MCFPFDGDPSTRFFDYNGAAPLARGAQLPVLAWAAFGEGGLGEGGHKSRDPGGAVPCFRGWPHKAHLRRGLRCSTPCFC